MWQYLYRNSLHINWIQCHSVHAWEWAFIFLSKHYGTDGPEQRLTRLSFFSQGANQHQIDWQPTNGPSTGAVKGVSVYSGCKAWGEEKQHSHMNSGSLTFSVIHGFHSQNEWWGNTGLADVFAFTGGRIFTKYLLQYSFILYHLL